MDKQTPPTWFWVAAALGLLWNMAGVAAFVAQMTMNLSTLPDAQRAFHQSTPLWATMAFAIAVAGGFLGCLALLFRKSLALPILVVSLIGVVVQISHSFVIGNGLDVFGPQGLILPVLTFTFGVALAWFAKNSVSNRWLA